MARGAVALTAVVVLSQPAWAQAADPVRPQDDPAKPQVQTFEMVLARAVETGGQNFARRAAEMAPSMMPFVFPIEAPVVNGIADRDMGLYVFQVQVPGIGLTLQVMNMMVNRPGLRGGRADGTQQVGSGRVAATGVVPADPMDAGPVETTTGADFLAEWRQQVGDALVEAMIDNAGALPMAPTDTLLVFASGIEPTASNPLYRLPSGKLVLKAKGSDLAEFRQGQITREEVRKRIQVARF
jgi:hypothetical protein